MLGVAVPVRAAEPVRCGRAVAGVQAVLDRDLECAGPGPILRNPRTVLQLNGHTIRSRDACDEEATAAGVVVEATAEGALVLGPGTVRGFATGIAVAGADRVEIHDVRVAESCVDGVAVSDARAVRIHRLIAHRNGARPGDGGGLRVARSDDVALESSALFANGAGADAAGVELRDCKDCRLTDNRILANRDVGLRLDVESQGTRVERNVILDNRRFDVVDEGADNTFALNVFERAQGVAPPALAPLVGSAPPTAPAVTGCGIMQAAIGPRATATVACPHDPGLRGLRNSVVAYRLLNAFRPLVPVAVTCDPVRLTPAGGEHGGRVECTNPSPFAKILQVTCCLN